MSKSLFCKTPDSAPLTFPPPRRSGGQGGREAGSRVRVLCSGVDPQTSPNFPGLHSKSGEKIPLCASFSSLGSQRAMKGRGPIQRRPAHTAGVVLCLRINKAPRILNQRPPRLLQNPRAAGAPFPLIICCCWCSSSSPK